MFVWIDLNVLMYHALSLDRSDLKEMKGEIQTVRKKLNEGTDFFTPLEIVILLYENGLSAKRKKITRGVLVISLGREVRPAPSYPDPV